EHAIANVDLATPPVAHRIEHDGEVAQRERRVTIEEQIALIVTPDDRGDVTPRARAPPHESGGHAGVVVDRDQREPRLVDLAAQIREAAVGTEEQLAQALWIRAPDRTHAAVAGGVVRSASGLSRPQVDTDGLHRIHPPTLAKPPDQKHH